jgi:hypothetical protein
MLMSNPDSAYHLLKNMSDAASKEDDYEQMCYDLLLFRAEDLCYLPHHNTLTIQRIITYATTHHDKNLLMQAYYCMGCLYRDKDDAQQALIHFQKSLDNSEGSSNYDFIARIYRQMGHLQILGYSYEEALPLYQKALHYFKLADDRWAIPDALTDIAHIYDIQHNYHIALNYSREAYRKAYTLSDKSKYDVIAIELSEYYYKLGLYDSTKSVLGNIAIDKIKKSQDKAIFYLQKGYISYLDNHVDSAITYFEKAARYGENRTKRGAYSVLCELYRNEDNTSQALKYALLSQEAAEKEEKENHNQEVTQLQSLYNYNRTEVKNKILADKNKEKERIIFIMSLTLLSFCIGALLYRQQMRRKRELQNRMLEKLNEQNKMSREYINKKEQEIEELKKKSESNTNPVMALKLQRENDKSKADIRWSEEIWHTFRAEKIYREFHDIIRNEERPNCIAAYFEKIREKIDLYFDNFGQRLQEYDPDVSRQQLRICYLIKAEFTPVEMSAILHVGKQAVSNIRKRMAQRYFNGITNGKTIDEFIHDF